MEYKVLPFHPTVTDKAGASQAAKELQEMINKQAEQGWNFKSLQSMSLDLKPTGCFSFNAAPVSKTMQLVVFEK